MTMDPIDISVPLFRFPLGHAVRWAASPAERAWIRHRRWTERDGLGPVVEYALEWRSGRSLCWAYEADVTCWPEPQTPQPARRDPLPPIDLGNLDVEPTAEGRLLRLTIAEQQSTTTLSREGAMALWTWLYDWLWTPEEVDAIVAKVRLELTR